MISRWKVLDCVAKRYGDNQPAFEEAQHRLTDMRKNNQSPLDLEDDQNRVRLRLAREGDPQVAMERIVGTVDFQDVYVFELLSALSKSVCRITLGSRPIGTGFLVGKDILLTNHHVIENAPGASDMFAEFDYEMSPPPNTGILEKSIFRLDASRFFLTSSLSRDPNVADSGLDFTLIGLDPESISGKPLSAYSPVSLDGNSGKIIKGESCIIIQHPDGKPKKVVLKNSGFFSETDSRLVYETDTLPGSSGSMVVALGTCEVIALHHAGLPRTDDQNRILTRTGDLATESTPDDEIDWIGNEGIKISRIIQALKSAQLPPAMNQAREALLTKTQLVKNQLDALTPSATFPLIKNISGKSENSPDDHFSRANTSAMYNNSKSVPGRVDFLVTAVNSENIIKQIESILAVKYNGDFIFHLAMPASAVMGEIELFRLQVLVDNTPETEIKELISIPGILQAEADLPLAMNADTSLVGTAGDNRAGVESVLIANDGLGTPNEEMFRRKYMFDARSKYVVGKSEEEFRKWNWEATGFDKVIKDPDTISPQEKGIRIVQFDTGYSDHPKVAGGFDLDNDVNFIDENSPADARDPGTVGLLKHPGHGTRTGSLLIGNEQTIISNNGNCGLLSKYHYKLAPFRICESVILINRQQQMAAALDMAIGQGFDIISLSMGLPPTIATAKMAKKAYDKGVIWCCAAGNEVQFVVAPAVFPGSIAVAASNPLDRDWSRSSRGDAVDITAPGEDVYVPILFKDSLGQIQDGFCYGDGTSYATPHVAAAAAYWLARYQSELNSADYGGWKRVEAFRQALKDSARRDNELPTKGFGHGILDVKKLLNTPPTKASELEYAYRNWNENAFFATIQGYGELVKTYWNKLHGLIFGVRRGGQESLVPGYDPLSPLSMQIETALFGVKASNVESLGSSNLTITNERLQALHEIIISSAQKLP